MVATNGQWALDGDQWFGTVTAKHAMNERSQNGYLELVTASTTAKDVTKKSNL